MLELLMALTARLLLAILGLLVVKLSFEYLDEENFIRYGYALLSIAISSSLLYPINRRFWADYSPVIFNKAIYSCGIILFLFLPPVFIGLTIFLEGEITLEIIPIVIVTVIFSFAQSLGRYLYGSMVMEQKMLYGLTYTFIFILIELMTLLLMAFLGNESLLIRLGIPAICFLILLSLNYWIKEQKHLLRTLKNISYVPIIDIFNEIFCSKGRLTIVASVLITLSSMIDRIAFPEFCSNISNMCTNAADLVLISMYCSAFLSILTIIIDWLRPRIFFNGQWQINSKHCLILALSLLTLAVMIAISLGWVIGRRGKLIPESISWLIWAMMVIRFGLLACINVFQIDLWMSNQFKKVLLGWLFVSITFPLGLLFFYPFGLSVVMVMVNILIMGVCMDEAVAHWSRRKHIADHG